MSSPELVLIDSHALLYRTYYAYPPLSTSTGQLINAVYGYLRIILRLIQDKKPLYIATAFDVPKPTFRHTDFAGYKAQRKEMPGDLQPQIEMAKEFLVALNIPLFAVEGYEADDVIGTLSCQAAQSPDTPDLQVTIVTGDQDSFQLVNDQVHVLMPSVGKNGEQEYGEDEVVTKLGVKPSQVVDYKALAGDSSDNIPGVAGIGKKTATTLIQKYGNLENLYQHVLKPEEKEFSAGVLKKLANGYESALLSQKLARIDCQVPIHLDLELCRVSGYDKAKAVELLKQYEFGSLIPLLPPDDFELGVQEAFL